MTENSDISLEERLLRELRGEFAMISSATSVLLNDGRYDGLRAQYESFVKEVGSIEEAAKKAMKLIETIRGSDNSALRTAMHDINNLLVAPAGRSELFLTNTNYRATLSEQDYHAFVGDVSKIRDAARNATQLARSIGGFYRAKEYGVELVDSSKLGTEEVVCHIVHVDDDEEIRLAVKHILKMDSNIITVPTDNNDYAGIFGHNGRKVKYKIHSYGSVIEALNGVRELASEGVDIDLLITDREMPGFNGFHLLYTISQLPNAKLRMPEYKHVKNIAMLTAGITQEQAEWVTKTYDATVIDKSVLDTSKQPSPLEQQIYSAINRKEVQS